MSGAEPTAQWQFEADLLADGMEALERWTRSLRVRDLYPEGPSPHIVLSAYQELDRLRAIGRRRGSKRRQSRALRALVRAHGRRDALTRLRRLEYRFPPPRVAAPLHPPDLLLRALARVDADVRAQVRARVLGREVEPPPDVSVRTEGARMRRGLDQLREAFVAEAFAAPHELARLNPDLLPLAATGLPSRRRRPVAMLLLVTLPLRVIMSLLLLLSSAYVGAWVFFNDAVLGAFVSKKVSGLFEGDLEMGSIHWDLTLIADLVTGRPTHVVVEDITVWEPYKSYGGERKRWAAHAERLDAGLVLHEIIPWNRLGIPAMLEIPWILHMTEVRGEQPTRFIVRAYEARHDDGRVVSLIGLRDAFALVKPLPAKGPGLSIQVDEASLARADLTIDFVDRSGFGVGAALTDAVLAIDFRGQLPGAPPPTTLPMTFSLRSHARHGSLHVADIDVPLGELNIQELSTGASPGDVDLIVDGIAAGSPMKMSARLGGALARPPGTSEPLGGHMTVQLLAETEDAGPVVAEILDALDLPPAAAAADGAQLQARIEGPLASPVYTLQGAGFSFDPLDEPSWAADDVDLLVTIADTEVAPPATLGGTPDGAVNGADPVIRRVVDVDRFEGAVWSGTFRQRDDTRARIVMPAPGEPWRMQVALDFEGLDPSALALSDDDLADRLRGSAHGGIDVRQLVIDPGDDMSPGGLRRAELVFSPTVLRRDHGPADDGMPRRIELEGTVIFAGDDVDLEGLRISTDGASLSADAELREDFTEVARSALRLRIDDGRAFARAFAIDPYFDSLRLELGVFGPLSAPSSRHGTLHATGIGATGTAATDASIWLERGTVHIVAPRANLFGGTGTVEAEIVVWSGGELLEHPRLKATIDLRDAELSDLAGKGISGEVDAKIRIDDGHGKPAPIDRLTIAGSAFVPRLRLAETIWHGATVDFVLEPDALVLERLRLPLSRPVSPRLGTDPQVSIGEIVATGRIGRTADPELALDVEASGVPLPVVARLLDLDAPLRGQIARGTTLRVEGTLKRPAIEGQVQLAGLSAGGIALGSGALQVTSTDAPREGPLAAHREVRVLGDLADERGPVPLRWSIDAVLAIGVARAGANPPIDAEVDVTFDRVALSHIRPPEGPNPPQGQLEGLLAHVVTCSDQAAMLSSCVDPADKTALAVELRVQRAWLAARPIKTGDPCAAHTTLCTQGEMVASLDWPRVSLERPLELAMGGKKGSRFTLSGGFDLSGEAAAATTMAATTCRPPAVTASTAGETELEGPTANITGTIDLVGLAPLLDLSGVKIEAGRVDVDAHLAGRLGAPSVHGRATLHDETEGLRLVVPGLGEALVVSDLDVRVVGDWLAAMGSIEWGGQELRFGTVKGEHTGVAIAGPCTGAWGAAAQGVIPGRLIDRLLGLSIVRGGSVALLGATARGDPQGGLSHLAATVSFAGDPLDLALAEGLDDLVLSGGRADIELCGADRCPDLPPGTIAVHLGGRKAAGARTKPPEAVRAELGAKGRLQAWGSAWIAPDGSHFEASRVQVEMSKVPYHSYDSRGRPVYEIEMTAPELHVDGGDPLVVSGDVTLDRARYVKDAVQGVDLLTFSDDVDELEAPPPELLRTVQFGLSVRTDAPARIENNVAHGIEAELAVDVTGTYERPELTGRLELEAGGTVDLPFLTGTYEIERGRVVLVGQFADAEVDVLAERLEPVYIGGQAQQMQLLLGGTISAITWECIAAGDTTGAVDSQRGCLDYLVLGAGDIPIADSDVLRLGGGGLQSARKPLQVVGHVTEFDFGQRIKEASPRYRAYVPDLKLRLGQIGPEIEIATPPQWLDFDYAKATLGYDYTRGYPGLLLRQSRELSLRVDVLESFTMEFRRDIRSYLNQRVVFDPLHQRTLEFRFDFDIPSLR